MRYALFFLAIAAGVGLGLFYGWVVSPVQLVDTAPSSLRADFKADYALMVAESYEVQPDLNLAARRLAQLGGHPLDTVQAAAAFAVQVGYDPRDLALLRDLAEALKAYNPALESGGTPTP
ncbi:MAG: hypothetical protein HYZ26_11835 [Chloroflexi bacterium]|nr:hypothetical protein [Chloroflexota bacterium]